MLSDSSALTPSLPPRNHSDRPLREVEPAFTRVSRRFTAPGEALLTTQVRRARFTRPSTIAITTAVVAAIQGKVLTRSDTAASSGVPVATTVATTAAVISGGCTAAVNRPPGATSRAAATQPSPIPAGSQAPPSRPPAAPGR
ncbi:hypothetical protein GCM10010452_04370 [Crossiella cryophila]